MDPNSGTVRVDLTPAAGFCIKSKTLQAAVCKVSAHSQQSTKLDAPLSGSLGSVPGTLSVPKGTKVFINIAWDANVPPPPEGNEEAIQNAMRGEEELDENTEKGWFVPVIVSEPRSDADKAGKLSVVFDCVYNASLKSRCLRDHAFRAFLVELGLQRIEAQHSLLLSRQLGTPNIASKGKLQPRSALVPLILYPETHPLRAENKAKRLIEEIEPLPSSSQREGKVPVSQESTPSLAPKSILKKPAPMQEVPKRQEKAKSTGKSERPKFEWAKDGDLLPRVNTRSRSLA
ncbi:hypothetical protein NM688_g3826 [Phlebia brevispora]|uniref:Uncharacterized protein n=1 Tax=Phlebia brevispora TaxID=194682 RepID=A0ACC1T4T3_9APHY|nr:hypothetical protein NM688_g3826 [Phlebia brevispora]